MSSTFNVCGCEYVSIKRERSSSQSQTITAWISQRWSGRIQKAQWVERNTHTVHIFLFFVLGLLIFFYRAIHVLLTALPIFYTNIILCIRPFSFWKLLNGHICKYYIKVHHIISRSITKRCISLVENSIGKRGNWHTLSGRQSNGRQRSE